MFYRAGRHELRRLQLGNGPSDRRVARPRGGARRRSPRPARRLGGRVDQRRAEDRRPPGDSSRPGGCGACPAGVRRRLRSGPRLRASLSRRGHALFRLRHRQRDERFAGVRLRRLFRRADPDQLACDHHGRRRWRDRHAGRRRLRRVSGSRPGQGHDRGLGRVRRRRRSPGRPEGARADSAAARRLEPGGRRRARRGDRQPVRERELAHGRRRLGDPALDRVSDLAVQPGRRDPGGCADQSRQLRWSAVRRCRDG